MNAIDSMLDFQAGALRLRGERERVIASNIANADTPGYKARDFDFAKALAEATGTASAAGAGGAAVAVAATQPGHIGYSGSAAPTTALSTTALAYRTPNQASLDGNSVEIDVERAKFAENTVRYEAALRFLGGNIKSLQAAITGQ